MIHEKTIAVRHRGSQHGPITRLIAPSTLGDQLKPFIFLDFFNAPVQRGFGFPMHPHSGIATLTWQPGCDVRYQDTTGKNGVLKAGGLEWMNAGGGAWHQGIFDTEGLATGFQLWVAMPPGVEDGASEGQYIPPDQVPTITIPGGEIKVLLGEISTESGMAQSPIKPYQDMNYLVLTLGSGSSWRYEPPTGHNIAWAVAFEGTPLIQGEVTSKEILVLDGSGAIEVSASTAATKVLIGTAKLHDHDLVLGPSSVHTNRQSLIASQQRIREIGESLRQSGHLR